MTRTRTTHERRMAPGHARTSTRASIGLVVLACSSMLWAVPLGRPAAASPTSVLQQVPTLNIIGQDFEVAPDGGFGVVLDIKGAPAGSDLAVQIYDRIDDDAALTASTTDDPDDLLATFDLVPLSAQEKSTQPALFAIQLYRPGEDRPAGVSPGWSWQLEEPGVYPVRVRLRGPTRRDLATVVTYLVRQPDGPAQSDSIEPASLALVAEVSTPPPSGSEATEAPEPGFLDAVGELTDELAEHPDAPVSFAVSPDTATRLNEDPASTETLTSLRAEIERPGRELLGAPYVDIDATALVDADLADEVIRQRDYGRRTLDAAFGLSPTEVRSNTWMLHDQLDAPALAVLDDLGIANLILPGALLPTPRSGPFRLTTPGNSASILALGTSAPEISPADPVLSAHQWLGRASARAAIDGGGANALSISPGSTDTTVLSTILDRLETPTTYLRQANVSDALRRTGRTAEPVVTTAPVETQRTSGANYPEQVKRTHQLLSAYASMLDGRPELLSTYEQPLARSASPALSTGERTALVTTTRSAIQTKLRAITTPPTDRVNLGTRDARFPLPITSTLDAPAKVVVTLEARDRLSLPQSSIDVTVANGRTLVPIPVNARATGDTPLFITVRTPDGGVILSQSKYTVRSTAVSGVGLILTIGAGGFLAVWWGRHWYRGRGDPPPTRPGRHQRAGDEPPPTLSQELFVPATADVTPGTPPGSNPR